MLRHLLTVLLSFVVVVSTAHAQEAPGAPDPARVRLRVGPLWLNPTLSLTNAGVDTNVFNDPDNEAPKKDFNITVTPQTQLWLRMGRTWFTGYLKGDIVWFKKYASERSGNKSYTVGWLVPLTRLTFTAAGTWVSTHERPGFEIDARPERHQLNVNSSVEVTALSKTFIGFRFDRTKVDFAEGETFLDVDLHDGLNRVGTTGGVTLRHQVTPLTALTLDVSKQQDRFGGSPLRDSDSIRINAGVKFDPFALLNGSATFGYRDFNPSAPDLKGYKGTTAAVNLSYVAGDATRIALSASRDVQYSYDINQPYYLQTGLSGAVAQQIYGPLDVEARIGRQRLAYRTRAGADVEVEDRVDHVRSYGIGIGYRVGREIRIAFNVENQDRESDLANRKYHGLRYGSAITYGF